MADLINVGVRPNDGRGDDFRTVCLKLNAALGGKVDASTLSAAVAAELPAILNTYLATLPTTLPNQPGHLWINGGTLSWS